MYNKIFDFCKVRNKGLIYENDSNPTPRVQFLMDLLDSEGIEYVLDKFEFKETFAYNIVMKGTSNKMVVAHHDIVNPNIDNANDNSASVINAIMVKRLRPDMNVVILDGEEIGGIGSQRVSEQIKNGDFGSIEWVLNFELSGKGGRHFFIGDYPGVLTDKIKSLFNCPVVQTPFNDAVIFRKNGIDSVVINPLPTVDEVTQVKWDDNTYLDFKLLFNCHNAKDTLETIDPADMKEFVEEVVLKIIS
jgi:hypothetical protein